MSYTPILTPESCDPRDVHRIAGEADIDPRTVRKYLACVPIHDRKRIRIEAAIRTLGLVAA